MKGRKVICILLSLVMILTFVPTVSTSYGGLVSGQSKAKVQLVALQPSADSAVYNYDDLDYYSKYEAVDTDKISSKDGENSFYLGVKATDFNHISEILSSDTRGGGLWSFAFGIVYDSEYLTLEPQMDGDLTYLGSTTLPLRVMAEKVDVSGSIPTDTGTYVKTKGRSTSRDYAFAVSDTVYSGSSLPTSSSKREAYFTITGTDATNGGTFHGDTDPYLIYVEFKIVKDIPTGKTVLAYTDNEQHLVITLGITNKKMYQYDKSNTDTDIETVINFETDQANISPADLVIKFDDNAASDELDSDKNNITASGAADITTLKEGATLTYPSEKPSAEDHVFTGWALRKTEGASVTYYDIDEDTTKLIFDAGGDLGDLNDWDGCSSTTTDGAVTKTVTLYARYQEGFKVEFNGNGGKIGGKNTVSVSKAKNAHINANDLKNITDAEGVAVADTTATSGFYREGYKFTKWNEKADGSGTSYADADAVVAADFQATTTLYAQWEPKDASSQITVKFDGNAVPSTGVSGVPSDILVVPGDKILTSQMPSANPTRTGYVFQGWTTDAMGTKTQLVTDSWPTSGTYTPEKLLDGTTDATAATEITTALVTSEGSGDKEITFYAIWDHDGTTAAKHTVTFNDQKSKTGGTDGETTVAVYNGGDALGNRMPADPTVAEGVQYVFGGWYTAADGGGTKFDASTPVTEDGLTIYAYWKAWVTLSFDVNRADATIGTGTNTTDSLPAVEPGSTISNGDITTEKNKLKAPNGYTFSQWNTEANGTGTPYDVATGTGYVLNDDTTFYAQWIPTDSDSAITITFDENIGGRSIVLKDNIDPKTKSIVPNTEIGALPNKPVDNNKHYTFKGWNASAAGTGAWLATTDGNNPNPDATKADSSVKPTEDTKYYAQWDISNDVNDSDRVTVTFDSNKPDAAEGTPADANPATITLFKGDSIGADNMPTDPTLTGYDFHHWDTVKGASYTTTNSTFDGDTEVKSTQTVYAIWMEHYIVTFDGNGGIFSGSASPGSMSGDSKVVYSSHIDQDAEIAETNFPVNWNAPTRAGYTFIGYYTTPNGSEGSEQLLTTTKVEEGVTVADISKIKAKVGTGKSTDTTVFYAAWKPASETPATNYEIVFHGNGTSEKTVTINGGTAAADPTVTIYTVPTSSLEAQYMPDMPVRAGYTFKGWSTLKNADPAGTPNFASYDASSAYPSKVTTGAAWTNQAIEDAKKVGTDKTTIEVYAVWEGSDHTVTFDKNDDNASLSYYTRKVNTGDIIMEDQMPKPTAPSGKSFGGWKYYTSSGTKEDTNPAFKPGSDDESDPTKITTNITVYAVWNDNVKLTFYENTSNKDNPLNASYIHKDINNDDLKDITLKYGAESLGNLNYVFGSSPQASKTVITEPTRKGFDFVGWKALDGEKNVLGYFKRTAANTFVDNKNTDDTEDDVKLEDAKFTTGTVNLFAMWTANWEVKYDDSTLEPPYNKDSSDASGSGYPVDVIKINKTGSTADGDIYLDATTEEAASDTSKNVLTAGTDFVVMYADSGSFATTIANESKDAPKGNAGTKKDVYLAGVEPAAGYEVIKDEITNSQAGAFELKKALITFTADKSSSIYTSYSATSAKDKIYVTSTDNQAFATTDDSKNTNTAALLTYISAIEDTSITLNAPTAASSNALPGGGLFTLKYYVAENDATNSKTPADDDYALRSALLTPVTGAPYAKGFYAATIELDSTTFGTDNYDIEIELGTDTDKTPKLDTYKKNDPFGGSDPVAKYYFKLRIKSSAEFSGIGTWQQTYPDGEGSKTEAIKPYHSLDTDGSTPKDEVAANDMPVANDPSYYLSNIMPGAKVELTLNGTFPLDNASDITLGGVNIPVWNKSGDEPTTAYYVRNDAPDTEGITVVIPANVLAKADPENTNLENGWAKSPATTNVLKVTVGEDDYTFAMRQLVTPTITLAYGNSPYGEIMKAANISDANKEAAKTAFNAGNKFTSTYTPTGANASLVYTPRAWFGRDADSMSAADLSGEANMDRNEYAQFIYDNKAFIDAGYTVKDALGSTVTDTSESPAAKRSITVKRMPGILLANAYDNKVTDDEIEFTKAASASITDIVGTTPVRMGVYTMTYTYADALSGTTVTKTRPFILTWQNGDSDLSRIFNDADAVEIKDLLAGRDDSTAAGNINADALNLYQYRIEDADNSGIINDADAVAIKDYLAGRDTNFNYYYSNIE